MEAVHQPSTPAQQPRGDVKTSPAHNAPEVVLYQPYPTEKPGTPVLSIHSHHSGAATDLQYQQPPAWRQDDTVLTAAHQYPGAFPPALPVPPVEDSPSAGQRICGIKKRLFVLLVTVFLGILGIAIGVGVGVGVNRSNNKSAPISPEPIDAPAGAECPYHANTQVVTATGAEFLWLCGVDYAGVGEANDISNERMETFMDCLEACARNDACTGAGWGPVLPDRPARGTCWLKHHLNLSHIAPPDWNFGILLK